MNLSFTIMPVALLALLLSLPAAAESATVKVSDVNTGGEDTSIVIKKGRVGTDRHDYEVVNGSDEIVGDPESGKRNGYASWKAACATWKKDMREMNKDNQILTLNCNSPTFAQDNGNYTYTSSGTYKLRVRMKINAN